MKKEFQYGDYCRFPNEQIPHILEILKANGHPVWSSVVAWQDHHDIVFCSSDNDMMGYDSTEPQCRTEMTPHDFMTIALRLEEGMGMRSDTSTPEQREHISSEMEKVGIKIGMSIKLYSAERNSIILLKDELAVCSNKVPVDVPYTELCRRLCVEPIGTIKESLTVEKTLEQHVDEYDANCSNNLSSSFDQTKPMQAFTPGAMWFDVKPENFVGFHKGYPVFWNEELHCYVSYLDVRNVPEVTAAMLEVGECMILDFGNDKYKGKTLMRVHGDNLICLEDKAHWSGISNRLKGRKVPVEIKIVE